MQDVSGFCPILIGCKLGWGFCPSFLVGTLIGLTFLFDVLLVKVRLGVLCAFLIGAGWSGFSLRYTDWRSLSWAFCPMF